MTLSSATFSRRLAVRLALLVLAAAPPLAAAEPPPGPPGSFGYGFTGTLGHGRAAGAGRDFLDDTWSAQFDAFLERGRFRAGVGAEFHRFATRPPAPFDELSAVPLHVYGTFSPWTGGRARPYLQARLGLQRLHPQRTLDRAADAKGGFSWAVVPGVEIDFDRTLALDLSLAWLGQSTDPVDFGGESLESWGAFGARLGLTLRPWGRPGHPSPAAAAPPGPWGVRRSVPLAAGQLVAALAIASVYNEYVHGSDYVQVSPRTWWRNLQRGFEYDQNKFDTNHFYHPWNGALFYSAGRSNGLGFWGSSSMALAGSFLWECCGETLPMSTNDLVSTSLGGVAMGEALFRLGSTILDNRDTGASRVAREVGVLAIDPVRGVNRVLSPGQRRAPNPEEAFEWRPRRLGVVVSLGARRVGNEGELSGDAAKTAPFADLFVGYGSVFDNERRRPYDSFWLQAQVNFTDDVDPAGLFTVRGDVLSKGLGAPGARAGAVALVQHFDYVNQRTWEFGAQSLALGLSRRFTFSKTARLELHVDLLGTVLASINSRLEPASPPEDPKALRKWEYGPGLGARAEALLLVGSHPVVQASYRYQWIHVTNDTPANGGAADHDLQIASLRLRAPLTRALGVGVDGDLFLRRSHYGNPLLAENDDRVPQVRGYLTWRLGAF